jgi:Tol biopolymer transport system component
MKPKFFMSCLLTFILIWAFSGAVQQSAEQLYQAGLYQEEVGGDLQKAVDLYLRILKEFPENREVAAKAQLHLGLCYEKMGLKQAQEAYQRVIDQYPEQGEAVKAAKEKLIQLTKTQTAGEKGGRELRIRRVSEEFWPEWGNALSSDGRYLVYTDWDTGDLAVADLRTSKSRLLTNKGPLAKSPEFGETSAFSPDDKQIAYGWQNQYKVCELRVIGLDGKDPRVLYRNEQSVWLRPHEWTPDGKQILILVMRKEGPSQIALLSATDGSIRILREVQAKDPEMNLSPDGRYIAYSMPPEPTSAKREVFIMKTDGSENGPLVIHAADDYLLGWAPDGRRVLFASDRTGSYAVWCVAVSEGRAQGLPELIKTDFNKGTPVRLTPNGVLYYALVQSLSDVYVASIDPDTGKIQGKPAAVKARWSGANSSPDWSPDGTRLAYRTVRGGEAGYSPTAVISIFDVGADEERQIIPGLDSIDFNDGPHWAPDGRSVLVIGTRGQEKGIYRVDVQTGATTPLVIIPPYQYILHAVWSPDAKSIFYTQGNPTRILRRDLDTGRDAELSNMTGPAGIPIVALSPDGKWLAFTSVDETLKPYKLNMVPSAGGDVREILRARDDERFRPIQWTPDGRFLRFSKLISSTEPKTPSKMEYWRISPDGRNLQKLEGGGYLIHPDGRQVAFTTGKSESALWALENFLLEEKSPKK